MSKLHEEIAKSLSPAACRALIDTPDGGPVALPPGPERMAVYLELGPLTRGDNTLTVRGEVVREYVLELEMP